jgi:hypothetical protein
MSGLPTPELGPRCDIRVLSLASPCELARMLDRTNTIAPQERHLTLALLTASAGLISALLSVGMTYYPTWLHGFPFFPGTIFGVVVSVSCVLGGYLHGLWKTVAITATSTIAYYVSFLAAGDVELHFGQSRDGSISSGALLAGGLTGAVLVLCAMSLLLDSEIAWQSRLLAALRWSPVGAVLGIVGWALGPFLGMAIWFVAHALRLTVPTETSQKCIRADESHVFLVDCMAEGNGRPSGTGIALWDASES